MNGFFYIYTYLVVHWVGIFEVLPATGKDEGILDHPAYMTFIPKLWTHSRENDFWYVDFNESLLDQKYVTVH